MPQEIASSGIITGINREISHPLRQELHAWGMSNALAANTAYRIRMSSLGDRAKQIAAPLEVIADLSEHPAFAGALADALKRQSAKRTDDITPMELARLAAEEVVARGARRYISAEQLRCELALKPESMLLKDGLSVPEDLAVLKDTRWLGKASSPSTFARRSARRGCVSMGTTIVGTTSAPSSSRRRSRRARRPTRSCRHRTPDRHTPSLGLL